ncbi:hypothetical protein CsatA_015225 [Cannabis sativa]
MAEAFLTVLLENLSSLLQNQIGILLGIDKEMQRICSMLSTIVAVIEDAEERQLSDRSIKNWLQKLTDVSSELEDILDDCCEMEAFRLELEYQQQQQQPWIRKVRSSLSCINPMNLYFRKKIANKMKEIGDRLDQIGNERINFHLRGVVVVGERRSQIRGNRLTSSVITQPCVYGREEEKERIVGFLVNDAIHCNHTCIYSIVGLGGMGKTTLAQLVFNDERVGNHFELKMWVCVSEDFDVLRLIKAIIESGTGKACEALDMDPLQKRLRDMLRRKRFLLVLDDVWNEDHDQWDKLRYLLDCGLDGASVVVTTRSKKVASIMGTVPMLILTGLSDNDCWLLFKERAFGNQSEERPNLVKIGEEIVKKCKGVPLAAKALGGLMRFKIEEDEWLSVMGSELWNLPEDKTSILPALKLSYLHLPIEHRRCFSYCAIFPKDHKIEKTQLIHLWMANGLISSKQEFEVEDVGNEMISELYWRSFFQDMEKDFFGNILNFKMHDLFHDLAQFIMDDKCRVVEVNNNNNNGEIISLSKSVCHLTCTLSQFKKIIIPSGQFLRTFMLLTNCSTDPNKNWKFHSLRALDAKLLITPLSSLSSLVSNLKHLRYLNLSHCTVEVLPDSICLLHHLLILDIRYCHYLYKLPKHMIRLKGLRHLYIQGCSRLSHLPPNIRQLTCLKTLSNFIVDRRRGCQLDELNHLNLGGYLHISNLDKVRRPKEARFANLSGKRNLKRLHLSWNTNENESEDNAKDVLEALAPSTGLTELNIQGYKGAYFPYWFMNEILGNVVSITLSNCNNCKELPPFGKLTSLRDLSISRMNLVEYIDNELSHGDCFRCLKSLEITNLPNLERLSRHDVGNQKFLSLSTLSVSKCPKLTLPNLGSVKSLRVYDGTHQLLESISNLHGLTDLDIYDNDNMSFLPQNMLHDLTCLQRLTIDRLRKIQELPTDFLIGLNALNFLCIKFCHELKCLPEGMFQDCTLLKHIIIYSCKKMESLSESFQYLNALESIEIVDCPELDGFSNGVDHLTSLRTMIISGENIIETDQNGRCWHKHCSDKPVVMPEALQHLSSLEVLRISYFKEIASLPDWLGNLKSLQDLRIVGCENLSSLPTSIQMLTNLKKLSIEMCPNLEKRCEKEVGEDWHKIAHISDVYVSSTLTRPFFF